MIISETIKKNDKEFTLTYSDAGLYIERNGVLYKEAIDPLGSGREYIETDRIIDTPPETDAERITRLEAYTERNTADIDYIAMMSDIEL